MRIRLISPARKAAWGESFWDLKTLCRLTGRRSAGAPLALLTLAALTPRQHRVTIVDEKVARHTIDDRVDLVGITGMTCVIPRAYEIADEYRRRGIPVVMGGIHVSMLPDEARAHCDAVVIGEAEELWGTLLCDAETGQLKQVYRAEAFPDLAKVPPARWDLVDAEHYYFFSLQTGRGCPFDCEFCSVKVFNGRAVRHKGVAQVVRELREVRAIDPRKLVFFTDDNLLADRAYAVQLMQAMIAAPAGYWWCQSSLNCLDDDDMLALMHDAGCRVIFVGFESVDRKGLEAVNKAGVNRREEFEAVVSKVHAHGIAVFGSFVLGTDADGEGVFGETQRFIDTNAIAFSMLNIMTPFPGTALRERLEREGRVLPAGWEHFNAEHVCFSPKLLTAGGLEEGMARLSSSVYSYAAMEERLKRLWERGVFMRTGAARRMLSRGRFLFTLLHCAVRGGKRRRFVRDALWRHGPTSVSAVSLALSFHDFASRHPLQSHVPGATQKR